MKQWRGRFNDGHSAGSTAVRIRLEESWLRVSDETGQDQALWALDEVLRVDVDVSDGPLRLRLRDDDGARLTVNDRGLLEALRDRKLDIGGKKGGTKRFLQHTGYALLGLVLLAVVLWFGVPAASRAVASVVPVSWEVKLGERALEQTLGVFQFAAGEDDVAFCTEPNGLAPLQALVERLAAVSDSPYEFNVTLVDFDIENAFALPGGQIVIFDGILQFMEEPEELTAVLAHEMAHVVHRHGTESLIKELGLSIIFGLLLGDQGEGILAELGRNVVGLSYSRDAEAEADSSALDMLEAAGLSGDGLALFFARLAEREGGLPAALTFLSTHPSSAGRSEAAAARAVTGEAGMTAEEWDALRQICGAQDEDA